MIQEHVIKVNSNGRTYYMRKSAIDSIDVEWESLSATVVGSGFCHFLGFSDREKLEAFLKECGAIE